MSGRQREQTSAVPSGTCGGPGGGCIHQELQARQCPWTMLGTVLGVHGRFSEDTQAAPGVPVPGAPPFPTTTRHGFHSAPTTAAPHCPMQAKLGFTPVSSTQHRDSFLLTAVIPATALSDHGPWGPPEPSAIHPAIAEAPGCHFHSNTTFPARMC